MGILEAVIAVCTLGSAIAGIFARQRQVANKMTRGQIIGEAEKLAWHAVEALKAQRIKNGGKPMSADEIWDAFKGQVWKLASGKGLKALTSAELAGMRESAEVLSRAAHAINGLAKVF